MNYAPLIINVLIIALIIAGIVVTTNPLFLFGLMFLVQMPIFAPEEREDDDIDQPMGFTAEVK